MILESSLPQRSMLFDGVVYDSTTANQYYESIEPLNIWLIASQDLKYYKHLNDRRIAHSSNYDPLSSMIIETDIMRTTMNDYLLAINISLKELVSRLNIPSLKLCCQFEFTHYMKVKLTGDEEMIWISRVDMTWAFSHLTNGSLIKFAILEFKRPEAFMHNDWFNLSSVVVGKGNKVCKQMKRYCDMYNITRAACCDYNTLALLHLMGDRTLWSSQIADSAPASPARVRWISDRSEIPRHLVLFLFEALYVKLRNCGVVV